MKRNPSTQRPRERLPFTREDRRLQIIEVAKQVFSELGYHNASVTEIIQRAGIARGTFYLYFTNKRKVFDAILGTALEQLTRRIQVVQLGAGAAPPRDQLKANLVDVLSYMRDDQPLSQLLLNHGLTPDAEGAERVEAFYAHVTTMIDSSLQRGITMGLVRPCDTGLVAASLLGAIKGAVTYMLSDEKGSVQEIADTLIMLTAAGVMKATSWDE